MRMWTGFYLLIGVSFPAVSTLEAAPMNCSFGRSQDLIAYLSPVSAVWKAASQIDPRILASICKE